MGRRAREYRAAETADAEFLAPRLNVACSFVRQERFSEATAEVKTLLARAYVPWGREVLEAADLGALKVHAVMPQIRAAMTEAAAAWGAGLDDAVLFVGRARAPLRIPEQGEGAFILNPHQEVYALIPETGRFRQLTAEDGRVLAFATQARTAAASRTPPPTSGAWPGRQRRAARRVAARADAGDDDCGATDRRSKAMCDGWR